MNPRRVRAFLLHGCIPFAFVESPMGCHSALEPQRTVQVLEIAAQKVPCVGSASQECMLVRESGDAEWRYFYDQIEGFRFEPGFGYVVRVELIPIKNPPQDSSSIRWRLLEVISRSLGS